MIKPLLATVFLIGSFNVAFASAQPVQRQDCNQKAEGTTGSERARIISSCIRRNASINTIPPMLARITECNHKAGNMEGDQRVKFVDKCMGEN